MLRALVVGGRQPSFSAVPRSPCQSNLAPVAYSGLSALSNQERRRVWMRAGERSSESRSLLDIEKNSQQEEIDMRETNYRKPQTVVSACLALLLAAGAWQVAVAEGRNDDRSRNDLRVVGLTDDGRLVSFKARSPERTRHIGYVTGLTGADTALVGIDFRVQNEKLYGVGNGGGVYTIDPRTAEATFVNALTVPLAGTSFGVDFNPAADRLRIVSDAGQNLAHNVNDGGVTVANATLTYTVPPTTPVVPALGVTAVAYTNNDLNQPSHGDDVVRPGHDAGPGCHPVASGQRHPGRDREARG